MDLFIVKTICVVGLGYIGLPVAVLFANSGFDVVGFDIDQKRVNRINEGILDIEEKSLYEYFIQAIKSGDLKALHHPQKADAYIIAVPTPITKELAPDLSYVYSGIESIAPYLEKGNLIVLESTSPVGTTRNLRSILKSYRPDLNLDSNEPDVEFAYCPERIIPGKIVEELLLNSRVIGGLTENASKSAESLYQSFCKGMIIITTAETAELAKLAENSFRDVNIAYANELAMICEKNGINVHELIEITNEHPRVNILKPGIGVGGHCIPVDPWFIVDKDPKEAKLIATSRQINDSMPDYIASFIKEKMKKRNIKSVGLLGLSYKPNVDDFRCSPSITLMNELLLSGTMEVAVHDPWLRKMKGHLPNEIRIYEHAQSLIDEIGLVVISTPHSMYINCDFEAHIDNKTLVDPTGYLASMRSYIHSN